MSRHLGLHIIVFVFMASLIGCRNDSQSSAGTQPSADKKLIVGFSQVGAESAWRTAETESIKSEAAKRGIDLKFADAQGDQANQVAAIRSFVAQKVDAIVLAPKVETGWDLVLRDAKRANIPVILVDRGASVSDDNLYLTLIASDFVEEGILAADWLAKKMNGKANIVELQGTTGSAPAIDRQKGFVEAIKAHPDMKIVKSQSADFTRAKGKEVMEAFIKSDHDRTIQAVYAHNDDMALGAIQALEEAGIKPGKDVILVSIDGGHDAFDAVIAGKLALTVECNPLLGPTLFDTVDKVCRTAGINSRTPQAVPRFIKIESPIFDQSSAAEHLHSRKY